MIRPYNITLDGGRLRGDFRYRTAASKTPRLGWAVLTDCGGEPAQQAYQVRLSCGGKVISDSGRVESSGRSYVCPKLPCGAAVFAEITLFGGGESGSAGETFYIGALDGWDAPWIASPRHISHRPDRFVRRFVCDKAMKSAVLYVCGIGYHEVRINGAAADGSRLDPAWCDFSRRCQYVMLPEIAPLLHLRENTIEITVADGWRDIGCGFAITSGAPLSFGGVPQLTARLVLTFSDGSSETLVTDGEWKTSYTQIVSSGIYDGEVFDAASDTGEEIPVQTVPAPGGKMEPMTLEPITAHENYTARAVFSPHEGEYTADFGQNLAGVVRLRLPQHMKAGQKITVRHAEELDDDGGLFTAPLRAAKCEDTYIASGDGRDLKYFEPRFTYHGFRFASVSGYGEPLTRGDIEAVPLYTDLRPTGDFRCGSAALNSLADMVRATERSNLHSVLTDCPQRDERLGWMNDATVRFEETPYSFDVSRIFPKITNDLLDVQANFGGAIRCTAPFVAGGNPADPVCSSFLVAGYQTYLHCGSDTAIREAYDGYKAWEDVLLSRSTGYIVDYSYYGDWAGPAYACAGEDGAVSAVTPGILMSTGYSYLNCSLIAKFAAILGRPDDKAKYEDLAAKIKAAFLAKWYDQASCRFDCGEGGHASMASQVFPLWLGFIGGGEAQKCADALRAGLVSSGYRFTTGNLCSRYLLDVLARFGYVDDAYELLTRDEYPSFGYMRQNEATTVWERFEEKKNPGMNSHNHPMYASAGYFLYAYIAGIKPAAPGFSEVDIRPYLPSKLLSASATLDTPQGDVSVRWIRRFGRTRLYVSVPSGVKANVTFGGTNTSFVGGTRSFEC